MFLCKTHIKSFVGLLVQYLGKMLKATTEIFNFVLFLLVDTVKPQDAPIAGPGFDTHINFKSLTFAMIQKWLTLNHVLRTLQKTSN